MGECLGDDYPEILAVGWQRPNNSAPCVQATLGGAIDRTDKGHAPQSEDVRHLPDSLLVRPVALPGYDKLPLRVDVPEVAARTATADQVPYEGEYGSRRATSAMPLTKRRVAVTPGRRCRSEQ